MGDDEPAPPLAEYAGGFRDGYSLGFEQGRYADSDARRTAVEDAYRRGQQSAAAFYSTSDRGGKDPWAGVLVVLALVVLVFYMTRDREDADREPLP